MNVRLVAGQGEDAGEEEEHQGQVQQGQEDAQEAGQGPQSRS